MRPKTERLFKCLSLLCGLTIIVLLVVMYRTSP